MNDFAFIIIYLTIPLLSLYLLFKISGSLLDLTVPTFVAYALFVLAYLGYFFLYFKLDPYRVQDGVVDKAVILKAFSLSAYTLFSYCLGVFLCALILKTDYKIITHVPLRGFNKYEFVIWTGGFILGLLALFLYISKTPQLAIFEAFRGTLLDTKVARSNMSNNFDGRYHWYSLLMHDLLILVSFGFLSSWLILRKKGVALLTILSIAFTSFSMVMSTEKAPIVWYLLGIFFVYVFSSQNGRIPIRKGLIVLLVCLLTLLLVDSLFMGSSTILTAFSSVLSRATTGGITPSYFYIEFFPEYQEFLYGRSFPNPAGVFDFEPYHMTVEVMNWIHPEHYDSGIVGTAPTVFWGELYANFDIIGVLIAPLIVGVLLSLFVFFFNKNYASPSTIAMTVWLMLHFKNLAATGISAFIIDVKFWVLLCFVLASLKVSLLSRR